MVSNINAQKWVEEIAALTKPSSIVWIDGSEAQLELLRQEALSTGEIKKLNQDKLPGCYFHHSAVNDVARSENKTFVCTSNKDDVGPTNNWVAPEEMYGKLNGLYDGCMSGRTMYVIPFLMGPPGSSLTKAAIQVTDSKYVVLNMAIMARCGSVAETEIDRLGQFTKCVHALDRINEDDRYIVNFPEDNTIMSINSGYGGNALLGKKTLALRMASYLGQKEGWFAEHMLILGVENPQGETKYIAAAFPSACGKTNLAMIIPPESLKGYKVWTVGDDIAWMRIGEDGRLWAVNPETGFFGVAPGTSSKTNPNAMATVQKNSFFTNVLLKEDNTVWWEGMDGEVPASGIDWKNEAWTPESGTPGAHPNSRFTAPAKQCPCISPKFDDPAGVPISAIIFGGRRAKTAPLVYQSFDWNHGTFVGATMASETTAAATGKVGVVRRDPMAMLPFCGYNMGDYFGHWLEMGKKISNPPKIFHVNWFRLDDDGKFLWPGFGENLRVLNWILDRCENKADAVETPIGFLPHAKDLDTTGINVTDAQMKELLSVDKDLWLEDIAGQKEFFATFGDHLPQEIATQLANLESRLANWAPSSEVQNALT